MTLQLNCPLYLGEEWVLGSYSYVVCVYEVTRTVMKWLIVCVDVEQNRG